MPFKMLLMSSPYSSGILSFFCSNIVFVLVKQDRLKIYAVGDVMWWSWLWHDIDMTDDSICTWVME